MANDKQIKNEGHSLTTASFLPEEIPDPEGKKPIYSLTEEFAKSKKNRSWFLYGMVGLFMTGLVAVTIILTTIVQDQNKVFSVDIKDFEDINLSELLDRSKQYEEHLSKAKGELDRLTDEYQRRLKYTKGANAKAKLIARYQKLIQEKETEIKTIQGQVSSYDKRLKEVEKKAEGIVNNYQRLHRYRMQRQKQYYENAIQRLILKYNPYFQSIKVRNALRGDKARELKVPELNEYQALLAREGIQNKEDYESLVKKIEDYFILQERMNKIPYRNSVSPALQRMGFLSRTIVSSYDTLSLKMYQSIANKNIQLNHFQYAFDHLLQARQEAGYIVDPRNSNAIRVYVSRRFPISNGDTGFVFRSDDLSIGKIEFYSSPYGLMAKLISLEGGRQMEPFDKILIKIK